MRKFVFVALAAALLALPGLASAQKAGVCNFSGNATISPPIGSTPGVCTSASGCQQFQFSGPLSGAGCGGLTGTSSTTTGLFFGPYACEGNVHGGKANTPVGVVSYNGVCAGALCVGVAYKTVGGFEYDLVFDQTTINNALAQCPNNAFSKASFGGVAAGGSN